MTNHLQGRIPLWYWVLFAVILLAAGVVMAWYQGVYNWDLVAYTAVVLEYQGTSPPDLHQATFGLLRQTFPQDIVALLTGGESYNERCFRDPVFFQEQLGFYRVKPLYTAIVYLAFSVGFPLKMALLLPSLVGYVGLGLVSLWWCSKMLSSRAAFAATLLLMLSFPLIGARLITPDAMSAVGVVAFLAGVRFQWSWVWMLAIGLLLALLRIDHAMLLLVWLGVCYLPRWPGRAIYRRLIPILLVAVIALLLPLLFGNQLSWFFQYRFTQSVSAYAVHMANSLRQFSGTLLPVLLVLVAIAWRSADLPWRKTLVTAGLVIGLRWILFPVMQERFFLGYEMVGVLFLIDSLNKRNPNLVQGVASGGV